MSDVSLRYSKISHKMPPDPKQQKCWIWVVPHIEHLRTLQSCVKLLSREKNNPCVHTAACSSAYDLQTLYQLASIRSL